ncbi:hypothetical protein D3C76_718420 [compost metagenome]
MSNNAQARKAMMVRAIIASGGKADMKMKIADVEAMYNKLTDEQKGISPQQRQKLQNGAKKQFKEEMNKVKNEKTYTQAQVDKMIEKALEGPLAAIKRMEDMLNKMTAPAEQAPVVEEAPATEQPVEDGLVLGMKAQYAAICTERTEVYALWMKALRDRDKEAEKKHEARYNELSDARKKLEADPTFRTKAADMLHGTANVTRKYGHKTVDAVADVMHKGVDLTAKGFDKLGNMVDKKDRLVSDKVKDEKTGPADNAGPALA